MKAVLRNKSHAPVAQRSSFNSRSLSSTSSISSSRAAALARAAEASLTASERLSSGNPPLAGPSYLSRQDSHRPHPSHSPSSPDLHLSSSAARRSRASRFGSSRLPTYSSSSPSLLDDEDPALSYASPTGTSTSSIYLPEYVSWAISQLIAASNDPKLLRADHLKLAHLTDPQEHLVEAAHIPPKRSSLLHLATVSPHRYAAILAVLSEVRQRLSGGEGGWTPEKVLDFDCAAGEGLWAAAQVWVQDEGKTSVGEYRGFDRRPNLLKSGKKAAQSSSTNVSPADPVRQGTEVKLKDQGEEIEVDGVTYYEQEPAAESTAQEDLEEEEPSPEIFSGLPSAMASVEKTFQSIPLTSDLATAGSGGRSLALSAFNLSLMTSDANRFEAVQAMWNSNAEVIVIIDSATPRGFASVASARAQLLQLSKQSSAPAHVVAPCSHDKPCPLLHPFAINSAVAAAVGARSDTGNQAKSKNICGFTARYHAPSFLRRTKHSDRGEENVAYSYVVVRRGMRPILRAEARRRVEQGEEEGVGVEELVERMMGEAAETKTGILDMLRTAKKQSVERRMLTEVDPSASLTAPIGVEAEAEGEEMSDEQAMDELLKLLPDALKSELSSASSFSDDLSPEQMESILSTIRTSTSSSSTNLSSTPTYEPDEDMTISIPSPSEAAEQAMRLESYSWPRLIKSPLKKGGHVTLDACCSSGNIERFTISKASGKQAYQDARKSKWGDLFPHPPRSKSVVKVLNPLTALEYAAEGEGGLEGEANLEEKLVLRAPSKLGKSPSGKGNIEIVGLEEGEDPNEILRELFEDMEPAPFATAGDYASTPTEVGKKDGGAGSYQLISPNLVTPTKKQEKRLNINYAKKWDPSPHGRSKSSPAAAARLANTKTNLSTRQTLKDGGDEGRWGEEGGGFQSSLQSAESSPRLRVRRSSRKKSRGDWDQELFG